MWCTSLPLKRSSTLFLSTGCLLLLIWRPTCASYVSVQKNYILKRGSILLDSLTLAVLLPHLVLLAWRRWCDYVFVGVACCLCRGMSVPAPIILVLLATMLRPLVSSNVVLGFSLVKTAVLPKHPGCIGENHLYECHVLNTRIPECHFQTC